MQKRILFIQRSTFIEAGLLTLLILATFGLHFVGLKFGFPLLVHPDEPTLLLPPVQMTANQTLDPGAYYRPDLITIYINLIVLNVVSFLKFGKNLAETFNANQLTFYFAARMVIAIFGAALPLVAFWIGRSWRKSLAFPMALLFAFLPSYVINSHYATPDIPITFFTLLMILSATRYVQTKRSAWLNLTAILAAVNTAEKYPGLISLSIVFAAILIRFKQDALPFNRQNAGVLLRSLLSAGAIYLVAFLLLSPSLVVEYGKTIQYIQGEMHSIHLGADGLGFWGNLGYYLSVFYDQTGPVIALLAAAGVYSVLKTRNWTLWLAFYGVVYWIALSALALHWERWGLPMFITPLMLAALGFDALRSSFHRASLRLAVSAAGALVAASLFLYSAAYSVQMAYPDTRVVSLAFCQQNGITPQNSIYESYTPFAPQLSDTPFQYSYSVATSRQFVILSSIMFVRFYNERDRYFEQVSVYDQIQKENNLIKSFDPTPLATTLPEEWSAIQYYLLRLLKQPVEPRYSGPQILIYEVSHNAGAQGK